MFKLLYSWPDQLLSFDCSNTSLDQIAVNIRLHKYIEAESALLVLLNSSDLKLSNNKYFFDLQLLLFWLYRSQFLYKKSRLVLDNVSHLSADSTLSASILFIRILHYLDTNDAHSLNCLSRQDWNLSYSDLPFFLLYAEYLIRANDFQSARSSLDLLGDFWSQSLQGQLVQAKLYERTLNWDKALHIYLTSFSRFPQSIELASLLLTSTIEAKSHKHTLPSLRSILSLHGESPLFFAHLCRIFLLQNRSADSRRFSLKDRLQKLTKNPSALKSLTNYWVTQDRLGYSDWLSHIYSSDNSFSSYPTEVLVPMISQCASINCPSNIYESLVNTVISEFETSQLTTSSETLPLVSTSSACTTKLVPTIAWLTSDLNYHPVSRFLYSFFAASPNLSCRHLLVDINDHGVESIRSQFDDLPNLEVLNFGNGSVARKISNVKSLCADVAIDLNGWTGNNFMQGFHHGLAPIQVNYLGYFASTGLPLMDFWLGDSVLFPSSSSEWHTESLFRLQRCFIAWQPAEPLPEASIDVIDSSSACGVRFGSFNHVRKLSDSTLRLWGKILRTISDSKLVLKASNADDFATQDLLRRRMLKADLDVERVIWLPRTNTALEHLKQYQHIDVALDCFPNGGCTTTCEALWMGVPVITLVGNSYVSRMSTAVLHGVGLASLCADNENDYLQKSISFASRLRWLRANRDYWRTLLQSSPLGDASDLMFHLENSFHFMHSGL